MIKRLIKNALHSILPDTRLDAEYDDGLIILQLTIDNDLIWHQVININIPNQPTK